MAEMGLQVGVTPDRKKVTIALMMDGKQLGWIELTGEQCDQHMRILTQYRAMLMDVLPAKPDH